MMDEALNEVAEFFAAGHDHKTIATSARLVVPALIKEIRRMRSCLEDVERQLDDLFDDLSEKRWTDS